MSSANHFGKNKRSIKRQMAIARKSRSVRRNIEDNDMIEDRLSDRSSDTDTGDSDATIIIDTDPIPSTSSDESSLSIDDVTISRSEMKISSLRSPIRTSNKEDWMIVGLQKLNELLHTLVCSECHDSGCIQFFLDYNKRKGFSKFIKLHCSGCNFLIAEGYTSGRTDTTTTPQPFTINDMLVLFFNQIGTGYAAMQTFGSILGSEVLHLKTFQQKQTRVSKAMCESADDILSQSVELIRRLHFDDSDILHNDEPIDIGVSFDGSWHTRGHNSKYGFVSVIEITSGHVVDYEILCRYCQNCTSYQNKYGVDSEQYKEWYKTHAQSCPINYTGSSNAMEMEGAKRIWSRSVEKNNMQYVRMLGDGDSKAYKAVLELNPYNVDIEREECTNHAHKRMGTALRNISVV